MVWSALKDARKYGKSIVMIWLDLANAYGSVPHKLIEFALLRYHVPKNYVSLILKYYDGLWARTSSSGVYSDWCRYEKGILRDVPFQLSSFYVLSTSFLNMSN